MYLDQIKSPLRLSCSSLSSDLSLLILRIQRTCQETFSHIPLSHSSSSSFNFSDFDSLNEEDAAANNQLAFDMAEREFGIQPVTTGEEMAAGAEPDKLLMVLYLSKFYEAFRNSQRNNGQSPNCFRLDKTFHSLLIPSVLLGYGYEKGVCFLICIRLFLSGRNYEQHCF